MFLYEIEWLKNYNYYLPYLFTLNDKTKMHSYHHYSLDLSVGLIKN